MKKLAIFVALVAASQVHAFSAVAAHASVASHASVSPHVATAPHVSPPAAHASPVFAAPRAASPRAAWVPTWFPFIGHRAQDEDKKR